MRILLFNNLEAELVRERISKKELAYFLGISVPSLYFKLNGKREFTLKEMERIIRLFETYGKKLTLDYLFEKSY